MKTCVQCLLAGFLLVDLASAATITVRKDGTGDYAVLQQALNAAADGDSILIGPGQYTEMPWVRIPGYSWDVRSCGYIAADNLTIIGSGAEQTFIGPTAYSGNNSIFSPKALAYPGGGDLIVQDLTVRNCYEGIFLYGTLYLDNCAIDNNYQGIVWEVVGSGGLIGNTRFSASSPQYPIAMNIIAYGVGAGIVVERCSVEGSETIIKGAQGMNIIDCTFASYIIGISVYDNAQVNIHRSTITDMSSTGIRFSIGANAYCEIRDCEISGDISALDTGVNATNGRFAVYDSRIIGGSTAALYAHYRPGPCVIHNCDLVKGAGPVIQCGPSYAAVTHDLTNNYWGTTSEVDIQSWIVDHNDNPNIPATVLYQPFVGQSVPTESTSWGDLKALFRDATR